MKYIIQIRQNLGKDKKYGWDILGGTEQHRFAIVDAESEIGLEEKVLKIANILRLSKQSKLLDSGNEYIFHSFRQDFAKNWNTDSLRVRKGYKGYFTLIVVDGQKVFEDWVDGVDGFKSLYNYSKKYVLDRCKGYKDFILFFSPFEERIHKRPNESEDGYLMMTVKESVKRNNGLDIPSILQGLKDLGLGEFNNIKVRKDIIEILDASLRKANAQDRVYIENQYNKMTYIYNSFWGLTFEKGLPYIDSLRKDSIIDILEIDKSSLEILGNFKVKHKNDLSICDVLGIDYKDTKLTDEMYKKLEYFSEESIRGRKKLKKIILNEAINMDSCVPLDKLLYGVFEVIDKQDIYIEGYYCIKDKEELLLFLEQQPECYVDVVKLKEKVLQEQEVEYWFEVYNDDQDIIDIKAVTRENVGMLLNLNEEEKLIVGEFEY